MYYIYYFQLEIVIYFFYTSEDFLHVPHVDAGSSTLSHFSLYLEKIKNLMKFCLFFPNLLKLFTL